MEGCWYIDTRLPFGLRSAPKIFNTLADALEWVLSQRGIESVLHYLDDFLILGPPESVRCQQALDLAMSTCEEVGFPLALEKVEGPDTVLPFLGIELDTKALQLRLPAVKLHQLRALITTWEGKRSCTKRELLSLIGHLQHACKVVKPGRTFLRRMIDLAYTASQLHHHIRLNLGFRSDLHWWSLFLDRWNGVGMLTNLRRHPPPGITLTSDASGSWGCGAFYDSWWFSCPWDGEWLGVHITIKELLPIVLSAAIWGKHWSGTHVLCWCDNAAVVAIVNTGTSKQPMAMHLLRTLFFLSAHYCFSVHAKHLPGSKNAAADALSRDHIPLFVSLTPQANPQPSPIPLPIREALIRKRPDWTSLNWKTLFGSSMPRD